MLSDECYRMLSYIANDLSYKHCNDSSIDIEVIRTVFIFFLWRNFKHLKHKQKHLSNIQSDISKQKKHLSNIQPDISKQKSI